jgi:hypothetical protein
MIWQSYGNKISENGWIQETANALNGGSIISGPIAFGSKIFYVAEYLVRRWVGVKC